MPYIEAITKAGKTIEVERYYSSRFNRSGEAPREKTKPTREAVKKLQTRHAIKKLRRLMNANFGGGDYHLVLDYIREKGKPDRTKEEMKADIAVFLRECRKQYKKLGKPFKYIHVMEIGQKGARHHHLVVNKTDVDILQQAWKKAYPGERNRIKVFPLDDSGNYAKLAAYFVKYSSEHLQDEDRLQGKRWAASKNLVRPITKKRAITSRNCFRSEPTPKRGYYIDKDSIEKGIDDEHFGYEYLRFIMIQLE